MPDQVIWIAIEQRHLNKIARSWTIFIIFVQVFSLFIVIGVYFFLSLIDFDGTDAYLTPLLYITYEGKYFFYFTIYF